MQQATGSMQQATDNVAKTACNGQQTGRKYTPGGLRHAADTAQKTTQQTTGNGQRAACNRQRASDSRRHARGSEHMRDATRTPRHRRVSCAAGSGEPAACAKHCTRQPVRNKAQTPHTRCNIRPVPQHAATTYENTRGKTNEVRICRARWLRWTLGGGLTARLVRRLRAPLTSCSRRLRRADLFRLGDFLTFR